jgi:glycerate kinase
MLPMRKIIIAPDSYKGSLSSVRVAEIIAAVALRHYPQAEILQFPISDGGEGWVDALLIAMGGEKLRVKVHDPLGREMDAFYGMLKEDTAVIEVAAASGLPLLSESERDPLRASSFGTGELIQHAIEANAHEILLGLGGSATTDGGAGAASALGIRYLDQDGNTIQNGLELSRLVRVYDTHRMQGFESCHFTIACDVTNPLYGPDGAASVYAPQKGASPAQVQLLDSGLETLARVIRQQTGMDLQTIPGTGAAGGLAVPFLAFGNSTLRRGVDVVLDAVRFDEQLEGCDLVISGEGSTDRQSSMGKAVSGIARRCKTRKVPMLILSGSLEAGYELLYEQGVTALFSTTRKITTLSAAMDVAEASLASACEDVFRLIQAFHPG